MEIHQSPMWLGMVLGLFVGSFTTETQAAEHEWQNPLGGEWSTAANWEDGIPNGLDDVAAFGTERPMADAMIALDVPVDLAGIISRNPNTLEIAGDQLLTITEGAGEPRRIELAAAGGGLIIDAELRVEAARLELVVSPATAELQLRGAMAESLATLVKAGSGMLRISGDNSAWLGTLEVTQGTVLVDHPGALGSPLVPTILRGGVLALQESTTESVVLERGEITQGPSTTAALSFDQFTAESGIVDIPLAGDGMFVKESPGSVEMHQASPTFTGPARINQGVLDVHHAAALGAASGDTTVASGGTLQLRNVGTIADEPITLAGGTIKAFQPGGSLNGTVVLESPIVLSGEGTLMTSGLILRVDSEISGDGDLIIADAEPRRSYMNITGSSTHTGETIVNLRNSTSNVDFQGPGAFGSSDRGTRIVSGSVAIFGGGGAEAITVEPGGWLYLGPGAYTHQITLAGGTLAGEATLDSPLTLRGGGTVGFESSGSDVTLKQDVLGDGTLRLYNRRDILFTVEGAVANRGDLVAAGLIQFEGPLQNAGRILTLNGRASLHNDAGLAERELLVAGYEASSLTFATDATIRSLVLDARGASRESWVNNLGVTVEPGVSLTIADELTFWGGTLDGTFLGQPTLTKSTRLWGTVRNITGSDFERVQIDEGTLHVTGSLGDQPPAFHVGPSFSSRLELADVGQFQGDVWINGHPGHAAAGALSTSGNTVLAGNLFLGDNEAHIEHADVTGRIHGGGLTKVGNGDLVIRSGDHAYTGSTTIAGARLVLIDEGALATTSAVVGAGRFSSSFSPGELVLDNRGTTSLADRIADDVPVQFSGNTLTLIGREGQAVSETIGRFEIHDGFNRLRVESPGTVDDTTTLAIGSLERQAGSGIRFEIPDTGGRIMLLDEPALSGGLLAPWATFGGHDFATYGPNGVTAYEDLHSYVFDLTSAGPSDNVSADGEHSPLASDLTVNALRLRDVRLFNGPHTLQVETGGILAINGQNIIRGGRLTAGEEAGGELVFNFAHASLEADTRIVDGDHGSLSITATGQSGGLILQRANSYTGTTTISGVQLHLDVANALPSGGELIVDEGYVAINYEGTAPIDLERMVLRRHARIEPTVANAPPIDAQAYDVESGLIQAELVGTGTLTKTGHGEVILQNSNSNYSGKIIVREGTLQAGAPDSLGRGDSTDDGSIFIEEGGRLLIDTAPFRVNRRLVLEGGRLEGSWGGPMEVRQPSVIGGAARLGGLISGRLSGDGDLRVDGPFFISDDGPSPTSSRWLRLTGNFSDYTGNLDVRGGAVLMHGSRGTYAGEIDVHARLLAATGSPNALGTGTVRLHEGGNLLVSSPIHADVEFAGGGVRFQQSSGDLSGHVDVSDDVRALVYFARPGGSSSVRGTISGQLSLGDGAEMVLSTDTLINFNELPNVHYEKELRLSGDVFVGGTSSIISYDADVVLQGTTTAASESAVLDLIGNETFVLQQSFDIPAGTALTLLQDGAALPIALANSAQSIRGSGTLHNDLFLDESALISPGDSLGRLDIDGDVRMEGGRLLIEVGRSDAGLQHDVLASTGAITFGGALEVASTGDYTPSEGDRIRFLLTEVDVDGRFTNITLPVLDESLSWNLQYGEADVSLLVAPPSGDYNGNGRVEQGDLDLVLIHWGASGTILPAEWVRDLPTGIVDQGELDKVLLNWGTTPAALGSLGAMPIPEPSTLVLGLACLLVAAGRPGVSLHRGHRKARPLRGTRGSD